ncbi:hypothetical protein KSS87_022772 [Heliosperma pusillum]|nr:hypothetical protein KSS87_022772 [Heliosperma pusillum]
MEDTLFTHGVTMQTVANKGRLTQGVTMQTMGYETRMTHCSNKELQRKQCVMKQGRLIVHTRSDNANNW